MPAVFGANARAEREVILEDQGTHVDPELERQLSAAGKRGKVQAVLTFRTPKHLKFLSGEETSGKIQAALDKLGDRDRPLCELRNVFPNLQSCVIEAPAHVIRAVLDENEIASATANQQPEDMLIRPVKKAAVKKATGKKAATKKATVKRSKK